MTDEELLAQFLEPEAAPEAGTGEAADAGEDDDLLAQFMEPEQGQMTQRERRSAGNERRRRRAPPSVLEKSAAALQLGMSDAMSTLAGETYGRTPGTEGERTPVNPLWRPFSAAADVIKGGGAAIGETISGVDQATGGNLQKAVAAASENLSQHPIYSRAGPEQAKKDLREWSPEYAPAIEEAATVLSAAVPYAGKFKYTGGTRAAEKFPKKAAQQRRADIERRWQPEGAFDEPGMVDQPGLLRRTRFTPEEGSRRARMFDDVEKVDLDPRNTYADNFNRLDNAAEELRVKMDAELKKADHMDMNKVDEGIRGAISESARLPTMSVSGSKNAAGAVYRAWDDIIKRYEVEGVIDPADLMQARRDLDQWLQANRPKALNPEAMAGEDIAIKTIRNAINKQVGEHVPSANVKESLRHQSSLLTARDQIRNPANAELGTTAVTRSMRRAQEASGLAMPHSPAAVVPNLQPLPVAVGGLMLAGSNFGRGASRAVDMSEVLLKQAMQKAYNTGRGAIPSVTLPEEEENR